MFGNTTRVTFLSGLPQYIFCPQMICTAELYTQDDVMISEATSDVFTPIQVGPYHPSLTVSLSLVYEIGLTTLVKSLAKSYYIK